MALNLNELSEQFAKTPLKQKIAGLIGVMGALGAIFYFIFFSDLSDQAVRLEAQARQLQEEKTSYEDKKRKYMSFRAEVEKLLQEKKELVKVLPTRAEISSFLQSLHSQAELSGLSILTFDKRPEVERDFYAEIPVHMIIKGSYHQINKFFHSVGQLKRIVNIQDVLLGEPELTSAGVILQAKFVTSTFRFIERGGSAEAGG